MIYSRGISPFVVPVAILRVSTPCGRKELGPIGTWRVKVADLKRDGMICTFAGGVYHGKLVLPPTYPFAPPEVYMLTPSGRFETNKKICLSISNFHPLSFLPSSPPLKALLISGEMDVLVNRGSLLGGFAQLWLP